MPTEQDVLKVEKSVLPNINIRVILDAWQCLGLKKHGKKFTTMHLIAFNFGLKFEDLALVNLPTSAQFSRKCHPVGSAIQQRVLDH